MNAFSCHLHVHTLTLNTENSDVTCNEEETNQTQYALLEDTEALKPCTYTIPPNPPKEV
jgi:hypothetical protein